MAFPWLLTILARLTRDRLRSGGRGLRLERLEERLVPATYTVTNTNSSGTGSLAFELSQANLQTSGTAVIQFDPAAFSSASTITLAGTLKLSDSSVTLTTITGPSAGVTISGNDSFGVFQVSGSVSATLSGLTITHGNAGSGNGGGIDNGGTLTVSGSTLSGNSARDGGGIYNDGGTLTVSGSTLSANSAFDGGGIDIGFGGTLTVSGSTLSGNSAQDNGGGICNFGTLTVSSSTLSLNSAEYGGGICNFGTLTVSGSTLSGNIAFKGGGSISASVAR